MALKDYEGLWTVKNQPRGWLVSDKERRGRPRRKGPTKAHRRKQARRARRKMKQFYRRYPHLKPKGPVLPEEKKKALYQRRFQNYYLGDGKEKILKKRKRKKDPYWMGHIMVHNGVEFYNWKYVARKLDKQPRTFKIYTRRRIIPECMYILGARQWRYYSEYQFRMLRYGFGKVKRSTWGWSLSDLAQYLFENWTKYEDPESLFGQGSQGNSGGDNE